MAEEVEAEVEEMVNSESRDTTPSTTTVIAKDGRKWTVSKTGDGQLASNTISRLSQKYIVQMDQPLAENGELATWTGIPAVGTAHGTYTDLKVVNYDVQEGEGNEKKLLEVTVNYSDGSESGTGEETYQQDSIQVEQWGWESGLSERELITDYTSNDPQPVTNSVGDPFENAPTVSVPAPTFTKVMKFTSRQSGWNDYVCTINSGSVTIGGISFPKWTLLCEVMEQRIFGDANWKYRYTVKLSYKSNKVKLAQSNSETEVGWNIAIADAGMREFDADGKVQLITMKDSKTNERYAVTSPALLDGQGKKLEPAQGQQGQNTKLEPYNVMFYAYPRASFPSWFYSEPT